MDTEIVRKFNSTVRTVLLVIFGVFILLSIKGFFQDEAGPLVVSEWKMWVDLVSSVAGFVCAYFMHKSAAAKSILWAVIVINPILSIINYISLEIYAFIPIEIITFIFFVYCLRAVPSSEELKYLKDKLVPAFVVIAVSAIFFATVVTGVIMYKDGRLDAFIPTPVLDDVAYDDESRFTERQIGAFVPRNNAEKAAYEFYDYYLRGVYGTDFVEENPNASLSANGVYKLDRTNHINFLNESGYFSKEFYENEKDIFDKCDKALESVTVEEVTEAGTFPEIFAEDDMCGFVFGYPWVGGQGEDLNTVQVLVSIVEHDRAAVRMVVGYSSDGEVSTDYSYPIVFLVKEGSVWKISKIVLSFEYDENLQFIDDDFEAYDRNDKVLFSGYKHITTIYDFEGDVVGDVYGLEYDEGLYSDIKVISGDKTLYTINKKGFASTDKIEMNLEGGESVFVVNGVSIGSFTVYQKGVGDSEISGDMTVRWNPNTNEFNVLSTE